MLKEDLKNKIECFLFDSLENGEYVVEQINPNKLLCNSRFDIMAKYVYGMHLKKNVAVDWAKTVYRDHLLIWNMCKEENNNKQNFNDFVVEYEKLLTSVEEIGFDQSTSVIPVSNGLVPLNGSHRIASSLLYNEDVTILRLNNDSYKYDYKMFREKGLKDEFLDYMALQYCKLRKDTFVAIIFPIVEESVDRIRELLDGCGEIYYEKDIYLTRNGIHNLVLQMYKNADWIDIDSNKFIGSLSHSFNRYIKDRPVKLLFLQGDDLNKIKKIKMEIRDMFDYGNFPIHIGDDHEETVRVSEQVLNRNSLHFLTNSAHKNNKNFRKIFLQYKKWISDNNYDKDDFCIDGSAVLSVYGLREAKDLDYLHIDSIECDIKDINNHNEELKYYKENVGELIYNPNNYFYYDGYKFACLKKLREMKKTRGELKDKKDIYLINSVLEDVNFLTKFKRKIVYAVAVQPKIFMYFSARHIPKPIYPYVLRCYKWVRSLFKREK